MESQQPQIDHNYTTVVVSDHFNLNIWQISIYLIFYFNYYLFLLAWIHIFNIFNLYANFF